MRPHSEALADSSLYSLLFPLFFRLGGGYDDYMNFIWKLRSCISGPTL